MTACNFFIYLLFMFFLGLINHYTSCDNLLHAFYPNIMNSFLSISPFTLIGSNIISNIIEYFSFINYLLLFLFIIIILFFILMNSTSLYYNSINFNHSTIEFISTLFSLLLLIIIIPPALIILLDLDLITIPSYIIYASGLQWARQFNSVFLPIDIGYSSYRDHYVISIRHHQFTGLYRIDPCIIRPGITIGSTIGLIPSLAQTIISSITTRYLIDISQYILSPIYSFIRPFVYSFDVIHTLGFYAWGIKIDAIPGRINLATTLRLLNKGEYRGKCFESRGQGHIATIINSIVYCYW